MGSVQMKNRYSYKQKENLLNDINDLILQGYEGYVQFAHRPIDKNRDIFYEGKKIIVNNEEGFIYEAHFCNAKESIQIRQINDGWLVSKTSVENISGADVQSYLSDIEGFDYKIQMAQIWEEQEDEYCENMSVLKLQKVVFAGFKQGESK